MALTWTQTGMNTDGSPAFTVTSDLETPHLLLTGPNSSGSISLKDGTSYDVTALVIEVQSEKHAKELAGHIETQLTAKGMHARQIAEQGAHTDEDRMALKTQKV